MTGKTLKTILLQLQACQPARMYVHAALQAGRTPTQVADDIARGKKHGDATPVRDWLQWLAHLLLPSSERSYRAQCSCGDPTCYNTTIGYLTVREARAILAAALASRSTDYAAASRVAIRTWKQVRPKRKNWISA